MLDMRGSRLGALRDSFSVNNEGFRNQWSLERIRGAGTISETENVRHRLCFSSKAYITIGIKSLEHGHSYSEVQGHLGQARSGSSEQVFMHKRVVSPCAD